MTRRLRLAAVAVLTIAGCASNDAKRSDVVDAMTDAGLGDVPSAVDSDESAAECIGDGIDDAFRDDQELYNEVAGAVDEDELNDLPDAAATMVNQVLHDCLGQGTAGGSDKGDTTDTPDAGESGGETTDTTAGG